MKKALLFSATLSVALVSFAQRPKFVAFAWEFSGVSPQRLLKLADRFDETPLDGIGVWLQAETVVDGVKTNLSYRRFMHDPAWTREAFAGQIPYYRELTKHKSMRHSFVSSLSAPRLRIPWTDDAQWSRIAKSMRTVAWIAKEGGFKGLAIDPEDYHRISQFTRHPGDPEYGELCKIVRARARQLFAPVFEEYPDATLHFFWFLSFVQYYSRYDRADVVRNSRADEELWPSFVNGILDVLPAGASINDGDEEGYRHSAADNGYRNGSYMFHNVYSKLVAPENMGKYRRQVRYVPAVYMDMYTNNEGSSWYKGPTGNSRTETFRRDLIQASDVCGGYVWFWGEKRLWVPRENTWKAPNKIMKNETWNESLPGLFPAMEWVKDPLAFYDGKVAELGKKGLLVNLASTDTLSVTNGYATISIRPVQGGDYYGVAFDMKGQSGKVNVFFKDADNKYVQPSINHVYPEDARGVVRVPEGGVRAVAVFSAKNREGEKTVFENIRIYKLCSDKMQCKSCEKGVR